jgi:Rod binding domain-containing protein
MSVPALTAAPIAIDGLQSLADGAVKTAGKAASVAKDFESLLMGQLLKQMRQSAAQGGGMFGSDPGDVYGGLFDFFMGKHIANSGGLGIAASIQRQIQHTQRDDHTPATPRRTL